MVVDGGPLCGLCVEENTFHTMNIPMSNKDISSEKATDWGRTDNILAGLILMNLLDLARRCARLIIL